MADSYTPLLTPPADRSGPVLWFAFQRSRILVLETPGSPELPRCESLEAHGLVPQREHYLGLLDGQHCYTVEIDSETALPAGWMPIGLRDLFGHVDEGLAALSGRAYQILEWDRNHRYCGRCGTETVVRTDERSRTCPACRLTTYPPVSPAIMILITRGRELLLARKTSFAPGRYSALAGFVEPGETLEETVRRETREEVGVEISDIRYFGSQPWPFPHSLMVAFTAEYAGGAVTPDGVEIEEALWFDAEELPQRPPSISISRRLIDTVARELARKIPR